MRTGDLIVALDDQQIEDPNAFDYRFATKTIGGTSRIRMQRSGRETTVTVALEVAPELPRDELVIETRSPFQGVKVSNLSPSLADQLRLDPNAEGVVVVDVANGSIGQRLLPARRRPADGQQSEDDHDRRPRQAQPPADAGCGGS